jgi:hypothetical protein
MQNIIKKIIIDTKSRENIIDNTNNFIYNCNDKIKYINSIKLLNHNLNFDYPFLINSNNNTFEIYSNSFILDQNNSEVISQPLIINKLYKGIEILYFNKKNIIIPIKNYNLYELASKLQYEIRKKTNYYEVVTYDEKINKFNFSSIKYCYHLNSDNKIENNIYNISDIQYNINYTFLNNFKKYIINNTLSTIYNTNNYYNNNDKINLFINIFLHEINNNINNTNNNYNKFSNLNDNYNIDDNLIYNKLLINILNYYFQYSNEKYDSNINNRYHNLFIIYDDNFNISNNQYIKQNLSYKLLINYINNYIDDNTLKNNMISLFNTNIIYNDIYTFTDISNELLYNIFVKYDINNILNLNITDNYNIITNFINNLTQQEKNNLKTFEDTNINFKFNLELIYNLLEYNKLALTSYFYEDFSQNNDYYFYKFEKTNTDLFTIDLYSNKYKLSNILGCYNGMILFSNSYFIFTSKIAPNTKINKYIYISINNYNNNYISNNNNNNYTFMLDYEDNNYNDNNQLLNIKFKNGIHINKFFYIKLYDDEGNLLDINNNNYYLELELTINKLSY